MTQWTPLFHAAKEGHGDITELLIEHGADVTHRDKVWLKNIDSAISLVAVCISEWSDCH